jgi:hypothetical protein
MEWNFAVEEFTATGELIPSDRICSEEALMRKGWLLAWQMEDRDAPPEKTVSVNVYVDEIGRVLVDLVVLGIRKWILCRSTFAYLRFVRDWLGDLVDLKRGDDVREAIQGVMEDAVEEMGTWFAAPSAAKRRPRLRREPVHADGAQ